MLRARFASSSPGFARPFVDLSLARPRSTQEFPLGTIPADLQVCVPGIYQNPAGSAGPAVLLRLTVAVLGLEAFLFTPTRACWMVRFSANAPVVMNTKAAPQSGAPMSRIVMMSLGKLGTVQA
jgi:hypothetical protein